MEQNKPIPRKSRLVLAGDFLQAFHKQTKALNLLTRIQDRKGVLQIRMCMNAINPLIIKEKPTNHYGSAAFCPTSRLRLGQGELPHHHPPDTKPV
ncbi:hypothetical protein [Oscillibacter sp.]|uniref:hypothetical protein n=1 Tax=Oscillibacter sp. TaxID=1945593 RepID=UPI0028992771|nr:hypothetical protein [Oscillibacter sp.]